jgi:hypothetical protein
MSYHVNGVARNLPRLGARSVGALGALREPPKRSVAWHLNYYNANFKPNADQSDYVKTCMNDSLSTEPDAGKRLGICAFGAKYLTHIGPEQLAFYRSCFGQRPSDVPATVQHWACYNQAKTVPSSGASAPADPGLTSSSLLPPTPDPAAVATAGMSNTKWLLVGGGVALIVGYLVLGKKTKKAE